MIALELGHLVVAAYLVEVPGLVDIDSQHMPSIRTALHVASSRGLYEMVSLLLLAGANPHLRDIGNLTPLKIAQEENHAEVVAMLEVRRRRRIIVSSSLLLNLSHVSSPFTYRSRCRSLSELSFCTKLGH